MAAPDGRLRALLGHLGGRPPAAAAAAGGAPRAKARLGLVGLGWWTTAHHLPDLALNPAAEVVAVVEPLEERRAAVAEKYEVAGFATVWTRAFCHCPSPILVCMENPSYESNLSQ